MFSKIRWRLRAVETLPHLCKRALETLPHLCKRAVETLPHLYIAVSFSVYTLAICPLHLADLQTSERSKSKTS
jgi:hypothetical protein